MRLYESRSGVIFNLDRFVSFEVIHDTGDGKKPMWSLTGTVDSGRAFVLYFGSHAKAEDECRAELAKVQGLFNQPVTVSLTQQSLNRLS